MMDACIETEMMTNVCAAAAVEGDHRSLGDETAAPRKSQ